MKPGLSDALQRHVLSLARDRGVSVETIARAWGVSPRGAFARLTGRRPLTTDDIDVVARLFGMDPFDLVRHAQASLGECSTE